MFDNLIWSTDAFIFAVIAGIGLIGLIILLVADAATDIDLPFVGNDNSPIVDLGPIAVNTQVLMGFLAAFGAGGWVATGYFEIAPVWAGLAGVIPGLVVAVITSFGYRTFKKSEATSGFSLRDLVGTRGMVTLEIKPDSPGRISYSHGAESHTALAVGTGDVAIVEGRQVEVVGMVGQFLQVKAI